MKKIIVLVFISILSACTPQVTVTSQVTVTWPAPTKTPIPTPTLSPQFNTLQQQIATSQNYTLTQNGDIEFKTEEGVIIVPDIKASKENGEITFTENGEKSKVDPATISFDEDRFLFTVVDGDAWVFNGMALILQETQAKFDSAGIDLTDMSNASFDNSGLHITLETGEVVDIKREDLEKTIFNGQDNVLQIRDKENTKVEFAFDPETKMFLEASKYINLDKMNVEGYIRVDDMTELDKLVRITEMLSMPFPENTYFPPIDVVDFDWGNRANPNYGYPFGSLPEGMTSFLRIANYVIVGKDPENGRPYESVAVLQHAYNANDKTFDTIKYVKDIIDTEKEIPIEIKIIQEKTGGSGILLPHINLSPESLSHPAWTTIRENYRDGGIYLKSLIKKWFRDQHLPNELSALAWDLTLKFFR